MKGTVIKRGSMWSVVIDLGRDGAGKRIRKWHSGYRTKKEAEAARIELLGAVAGGTYVAPSRLTLGAFLVDEWLPAKRTTVKETTLASYEMHVRKHVQPRIGGISLLNVGASHLNSFYADLLTEGRRNGDGGLSPTTVRRVHSTLHKAFADAVRWGRLNRNPADAADPPRNATTEMSILEPSELRAFLESVRSDHLYAAWVLATTTGMRRGEILGLRWADIDLEALTLSISQIRTVANYQVVTLSPKTEKGARTISLDDQTVAALRSHRVAQMEEKLLVGPAYNDDGDYVFRRPDGAPIHPERFSSWFKQHCRRAGLPPVRFHDIRHSYVTALLRNGVQLKVVSQRVGHASPMVTLAIYQHVLPGDDRAAADIGADLIFGVG
jgi:integrase